MLKQYKIPLITIFAVLFIDQFIKIYIKLNYHFGDVGGIGEWCRINFTENPGMAFGFEFGGDFGKLTLSLFRILACVAGAFYIRYIVKNKEHWGFVFSVSLILAGAMGNIFDSVFYGSMFSATDDRTVAEYVGFGNGYSSVLYGHVVDMFYFPIVKGHFPTWFPIWGGEDFEFFRPVFNFADAAISGGVIIIIFFQKKFSKKPEQEEIVTANVIKEESNSDATLNSNS